MTFKHYDVVRAASPSDLADALAQKIREGWQPYGGPFSSYTDDGAALIQAIVAEGDVSTPVVVTGDDGKEVVISATSEPEYYFVLSLAGQSNSMSYGEGLPLPETYDRPDPRIKQLARRSTVTPGGASCKYNDIIPADHCLHDVQDMSRLNHPKADLAKGQYGCVGQGLHIARKLLPFIPANAGILLVPCGRGAAGMTITGSEGQYHDASGATEASLTWGSGTPLYRDLVARTRAALAKNKKNVFLGVVWMQGETDLTTGKHTEHNALFLKMVGDFRTELAQYDGQSVHGSVAKAPWICGDTTYWWKEKYAAQYEAVYGGYKGKTDKAIYFVPFMTDENGVNVPTNKPEEDPDIEAIGYYGSTWRNDQKSWTSSDRPSHFSSWARRGIISDRLATAILIHAGRSAAFAGGVTDTRDVAGGADASGSASTTTTAPESPATRTILSLTGSGGDVAQGQGWTVRDATIQAVDGGRAFSIAKAGQDKSWSVGKGIDDVPSLLAHGGKLSCKFRLSGALANNQLGMGMYCKTAKAIPGGIAPAGNDPLFIANFFLQTVDGRLNLMIHKTGGNALLGSFGNYDNEWHTLELQYEKGTVSVTPVLDGTPGDKFSLVRDTIGVGHESLVLTDITTGPTYGVAIESLTLEVNNADVAA